MEFIYITPNKDYLHYYTAVIIVLTTTPWYYPLQRTSLTFHIDD